MILKMKRSKEPLLLQSETVNPYRFGTHEILQRLLWDLSPESWRSRRIMRTWLDRHAGRKAVILCNGPSLLKTDFSKLSDVFTFGLNKINLLFDKVQFRPSCIVSVNRLAIEQNAVFFNQTNIPLFLDSCASRKVKNSYV